MTRREKAFIRFTFINC